MHSRPRRSEEFGQCVPASGRNQTIDRGSIASRVYGTLARHFGCRGHLVFRGARLAEAIGERGLPGTTNASDADEWKGPGNSHDALSVSHRWRSAFECDARTKSRRADRRYHPRIRPLKPAKFPVRVNRMHALQDRFPNKIFCLHHSLSFCHYFFGNCLRDYKKAVAIAHHVIARLDVDAADLDGNIMSDEPPAAHDVYRSLIAREHGKFELQNVVGVTRASIDHSTTSATKLCCLGRKLTEMGG